jgi:uncharacterized damage-inducible protein DinB
MDPMQRPEANEYFEYYGTYIGKVPDGDILAILEAELGKTLGLLGVLSDEEADYRYAPEKWSIKEVLGHIIDTERLFSHRALSFARNDPAPLPSMEQDDWAKFNNASRRTLAELLDELSAVRRSTIALFRSFDAEMWMRRGTASGYDFSVRTFPWIIAGHEMHHRGVLEEVYLNR